ncbi:unnamed protein product, partial [Sphacelaria rigidula]
YKSGPKACALPCSLRPRPLTCTGSNAIARGQGQEGRRKTTPADPVAGKPGLVPHSDGAGRKRGPKRISLDGLALEGGAKDADGDSGWDPRRYVGRPEEWFRPPGTVMKRRWDDDKKVRT